MVECRILEVEDFNLKWSVLEILCEENRLHKWLKETLKVSKKEFYGRPISENRNLVMKHVLAGYNKASAETYPDSPLSVVMGTTLGAWLKSRGVKFP